MRHAAWLAVLALWACDDVAGVAAGPLDAAVVEADAAPGCAHGALRCEGEVQQQCLNGAWAATDSMACCPNGQCSDDDPRDPCEVAAARRAYVGCEFWPVDLDNATEIRGLIGNENCVEGALATLPLCVDAPGLPSLCAGDESCPDGGACAVETVCALDAQHAPFAVVVSNPDLNAAATVTLADAAGATVQRVVAPGAVEALYPAAEGLADQSVDHSSLARRAYRLTSDRPVIAYQFNPLDDVGVFSNDGSLLLPRHAFDREYLALTVATLSRRPAAHDYHSYVTVVAPEASRVRITPSRAVLPGPTLPALPAGQPYEVDLNAFDVLNLETGAGAGGLTGTRVDVVGGAPVGVFAGHESAQVRPGQGAAPGCCADHLEEQLFPIATWGRTFAVARSQPRGAGEADQVRIVASQPLTRLTFDPPAGPDGRGCPALQVGEWCDVWIDRDTVVSANAPVLVAQLLASAGADVGDPAMAYVAPVAQYRTDYALLIPGEYQQSHLAIVAPAGATPTLDDQPLAANLEAFGDGTYAAARVPVSPGAHRLNCPETCAVMVHGYGRDVSYLFAGGLDLARISF